MTYPTAEGRATPAPPLFAAGRVAELPLSRGRCCMDARLNPYSLLGLNEGDAQVLRNAGGLGARRIPLTPSYAWEHFT
jgi:hypothetical protein